ncbi:MAG: GNAT family N-acetyltransferase [Asticcacaulis sp.]|nr:GNAT family N-acetyltransferase [Asticcacaulis sp.]
MPFSTPISIRNAPYGSADYAAAVGLRRAVLRTPLGLDFDPADLAREAADTHLTAWRGDTLVGAVVMTPYSDGAVKLRQMAVADDARGTGVGAALLKAFEGLARIRGLSQIVLAARQTAQAFYARHGYTTDGVVFEEVTLPHVRMEKAL